MWMNDRQDHVYLPVLLSTGVWNFLHDLLSKRIELQIYIFHITEKAIIVCYITMWRKSPTNINFLASLSMCNITFNIHSNVGLPTNEGDIWGSFSNFTSITALRGNFPRYKLLDQTSYLLPNFIQGSFGNGWWILFHSLLALDHFSMLGLKLIQVNKMIPWFKTSQ